MRPFFSKKNFDTVFDSIINSKSNFFLYKIGYIAANNLFKKIITYFNQKTVNNMSNSPIKPNFYSELLVSR